MRPVSQPDPCTNMAIRTTVTSWMVIWLMLCPQILPLEEAACRKKSVLFAFLPNTFAADDIHIGSLTTLFARNHTYILLIFNSEYILTET